MAEENKPASDPLARRPHTTSPQRHSAAEVLAHPHRHTQQDGVVRRRQQSTGHTSGFMDIGAPRDGDMMGPLLRRKKVVSLPLLGNRQGNNFFFGDDARLRQDQHASASKSPNGKPHKREDSWGSPAGQHKPQRKKKNSFMDNLIRRKQVALDLYAPNQTAFFRSVPEQAIHGEESIPFAPNKIPKEEASAPLEEGVEATAETEPTGEEEEAEPTVLIKKFSKKNRCRLLPRFTKKSKIYEQEPVLPSKMV
jgi:hypothetical protein